ncbi:hypothetical protein GCM10010466_00110 [Planomonospora alba]|uniref:HMA domain-containing protein n=1 Tax=Planomonospora alba TaxID=161354 RepID=A0ABP6MGU6_9ACTN
MTITTTYRVEGMTCGHCVGSVTAEVSRVPGVTGVDVDLAAKLVTVTSRGPLDDAAVGAAVDEAGYELTGRAGAPAAETSATPETPEAPAAPAAGLPVIELLPADGAAAGQADSCCGSGGCR